MATTAAAGINVAPAGGLSLRYTFDSATNGTPSSAFMQTNNATPSSATYLYMHSTDANSIDQSALINLLNHFDFVMLSTVDRTVVHAFQLIGAIEVAGSVLALPVAWISGTSSGSTNFSNGDSLAVGLAHADVDDVLGFLQAFNKYAFGSI
jgi:hypothetical protein